MQAIFSVSPVARWVASYLSPRGYEVELQEVERGWFQTVAVLKGSGQGRSIMFNGHLDINPLASGWTQSPFEPRVEGNRLYEAGIRNMKSGVSAMLHAAEAVRRSGIRLAGDYSSLTENVARMEDLGDNIFLRGKPAGTCFLCPKASGV